MFGCGFAVADLNHNSFATLGVISTDTAAINNSFISITAPLISIARAKRKTSKTDGEREMGGGWMQIYILTAYFREFTISNSYCMPKK